jgi:hypothetical protein
MKHNGRFGASTAGQTGPIEPLVLAMTELNEGRIHSPSWSLDGPLQLGGVVFDMQPSISPQTANAPLQLILRSIQATDTQQAGSTGLLQQQIPQAPNAIFPSQLFSDTLKMIAPVGQSPNDEQLLVTTLQSGLSQGLDHRRAIEKLHGVRPLPHVVRLLLNSGNRSTTTLPICGRIITSKIKLI